MERIRHDRGRFRTALTVTTRPATAFDEWIQHIKNGHAVISDASPGGLQLASDAQHVVGETLRIVIPAGVPGRPDVEVTAEVVWSRPNDDPRLGRHVCGVAFKPADQPAIPHVLLRANAHPAPAAAPPPVSPPLD